MDRFEKQFAEEEFHEYHSKTYFILIKKQFETFLYLKYLYFYSQTTEFERQMKIFQEYSRQKTEHYQSALICYLDELENVIVDRTHREHNEELWTKEKDVKDKQAKLVTKKQEIMILKSECSSPGDNSDAKNEKQAKEKCIVQFRLLYTHLEFLSGIDSENTCSSGGFQRAFGLFFGEEVEYFSPRMFFNLDKLENQLNNKEFDEEVSMVVFKVFKNQFQQFITKQISMDYDDSLANRFFTAYTLCDAQTFQNILISQIDSVEKAIVERGMHKKAHVMRSLGRHLEELGLNFERNQTRWEIGMKTQLMIEDQEWNPSGFIMTPS
ncbi:hypothetical protein Tco_1133869 [Tanacetum coccineum]